MLLGAGVKSPTVFKVVDGCVLGKVGAVEGTVDPVVTGEPARKFDVVPDKLKFEKDPLFE